MNTALDVIGAFILVDLIAAFGLALLVWLSHRRSSDPNAPNATKVIAGVLVFLGITSALIYGGLWMIIRATAK